MDETSSLIKKKKITISKNIYFYLKINQYDMNKWKNYRLYNSYKKKKKKNIFLVEINYCTIFKRVTFF